MKGIKFNKIDADIEALKSLIGEIKDYIESKEFKKENSIGRTSIKMQLQIAYLNIEILELKKKVDKYE